MSEGTRRVEQSFRVLNTPRAAGDHNPIVTFVFHPGTHGCHIGHGVLPAACHAAEEHWCARVSDSASCSQRLKGMRLTPYPPSSRGSGSPC
jgi:hypothetical protein